MLTYLGLEFEGREHSGIDDAKNIARIVRHLSLDSKLAPNSNLQKNKAKKGAWADMRK